MLPLLPGILFTLFKAFAVASAVNPGKPYHPGPPPKLDLHPIPGNLKAGDPLLRFMPQIYKKGGSCAPHVWIDSKGTMTNTVIAKLTCPTPNYGGQLIGHQVQYEDKYVLAYTAYYPFEYLYNVKETSDTMYSKPSFKVTLINSDGL